MRFDLADLSLFRHVVEAGSITHGAERAHLALAAASTRVRNMEQTLGAALFVRGRQGVALTQADCRGTMPTLSGLTAWAKSRSVSQKTCSLGRRFCLLTARRRPRSDRRRPR